MVVESKPTVDARHDDVIRFSATTQHGDDAHSTRVLVLNGKRKKQVPRRQMKVHSMNKNVNDQREG